MLTVAGGCCVSGWLGIGRSHVDTASEQKRLKIEPATPLLARYLHCGFDNDGHKPCTDGHKPWRPKT